MAAMYHSPKLTDAPNEEPTVPTKSSKATRFATYIDRLAPYLETHCRLVPQWLKSLPYPSIPVWPTG